MWYTEVTRPEKGNVPLSTFALPEPLDINTLLAEQDETSYDWLIPDLLERGDRLILTGGEGKGKSTLMRQIAVQTALGIHPFTLAPMAPRRVLLIDLENPRRSVRRKLVEVCGTHEFPDGQLFVARWPAGLDLTHPAECEAMSDLLGRIWPELLVIGPMYKLAQKLNDEESSAQVASIIDQWRAIFNFSVILEAHQPQSSIVDGRLWRAERPIGSSLWMRWPEFGICLEDRGTLRHWRGPREERSWPEKLYRGEEWPWMAEARLCLHCGTQLDGLQERYCSTKCGNAARVAKHRATHRV